jgi:hypothetical protein
MKPMMSSSIGPGAPKKATIIVFSFAAGEGP